MNKIFEVLQKPAKLILIIGGFVYAAWFAARTAMGINGQFMTVLTGIITLFVGTGLICIPPLFLLLKKDELAKLFFVFLVGFWVLNTPTEYFFLAETFAEADEFYPVFVSIFLLGIGLAVLAVLVLLVLEILFGMKFLRPIINLVALIAVAACLLTAILFVILCAVNKSPWFNYVDYALMDMVVLPVTVGFGCLYFFGASNK